MTAFIIFIILVALIFDFLNGFHDAANSIATVVSTRVLTPRQAVVWAAFFNFIAAFFFGTGVAGTIAKDFVKPEHIDVFVVFGGLAGACIWNVITWYYGIPSSSSHALIGGIAGAAITNAGWHCLNPKGWGITITFIFASPIIGMILGAINMIVVMHLFKNARRMPAQKAFRRMQLLSAAVYSLGHGGNDAQKTMGIIAMLLTTAGYAHLTEGRLSPITHQPELALWIILICHFAIAMGTMFGGWRIVNTLGQKITHLQPVGGFCAELAAASTIIGTTFARIPISTTHAITGSILGVGSTKGLRSVRWQWGERIVWAWILTIPCAALMASITFLLADRFLRPLLAR